VEKYTVPRKTDYFGSFLDAMSPSSTSSSSPSNVNSNASGTSGTPGDDFLNNVLKSLSNGDQPVAELVQLTGGSVSESLTTIAQLQSLGLAELVDGDHLRLTDSGKTLVKSVIQ